MPPALGIAVGVAGLGMSAASMAMQAGATKEQEAAMRRAARQSFVIETKKEDVRVEDRMTALIETFGAIRSAAAGAGIEAEGSVSQMAMARASTIAKRDLAAIRFNTIAEGVRAGLLDESELDAAKHQALPTRVGGRLGLARTQQMIEAEALASQKEQERRAHVKMMVDMGADPAEARQLVTI